MKLHTKAIRHKRLIKVRAHPKNRRPKTKALVLWQARPQV